MHPEEPERRGGRDTQMPTGHHRAREQPQIARFWQWFALASREEVEAFQAVAVNSARAMLAFVLALFGQIQREQKKKKTQWRGHHKSPPPKRQSKEPSAKVGNMQGAGNPVTFCFMAVDEKLHRRHAGRAKGPLHVGFLFFLFWNCGN